MIKCPADAGVDPQDESCLLPPSVGVCPAVEQSNMEQEISKHMIEGIIFIVVSFDLSRSSLHTIPVHREIHLPSPET